eukprot:1631808-Amphidinium_carterae.1
MRMVDYSYLFLFFKATLLHIHFLKALQYPMSSTSDYNSLVSIFGAAWGCVSFELQTGQCLLHRHWRLMGIASSPPHRPPENRSR